jgi:hypothetical protein
MVQVIGNEKRNSLEGKGAKIIRRQRGMGSFGREFQRIATCIIPAK